MSKLTSFLVLMLFLGTWSASQAADQPHFKLQKLTDGVYAYIGPTDDRTPQNLGLNNNIGFIETQKGWVLVDAGPCPAAGKKLEAMAKQVKKMPIIAVINLGSQDHRWLGNAYFAEKGAKIYAYAGTVKTQQKMFNQLKDHLLKKVPLCAPIKMKTADVVFKNKSNTFSIGGVEMQLNFYGDAHFPGDATLYLPKKKVLFTGDMVYVDRMLGIHPWSNPITWQKAYHQLRKLPAKWIVPGHGQITTWKQADQETGAYLDKLIHTLQPMAEDFAGVDEAVHQNADWPEFKHLKHYNSWHKTNVSRTYLKLESSL